MSDAPAEELPVLEAPADGVPPVTDSPAALAAAADRLASGSGPIALDAERAQGYRYSSEAYLLQLRRTGAGTVLVDPQACGDLSALADAIAGTEWILHAASQDIPCLRDAGLLPTALFDTELAARLLNLERVGLGALIEREFGVRLRKEHSAADWSQRPLPGDWLVYAALDVELLIPLREHLAEQLVTAGKAEWARQEFAALVAGAAEAPAPRVDPWRRTSGTQQLRSPRALALVRELWAERDAIARRLDKGPGRILPDAAIADLAALADPKGAPWPTVAQLRAIDGFKRRAARRFEPNWLAALDRAQALPPAALPPRRLPHDGPPQQPRSWERHHPEEYARWLAVRPAVVALAEEHDLPPENLLSPAAVRALAWDGAAPEADAVRAALLAAGARPWQADLTAEVLARALAAPAQQEPPA